MVTVDTMIDAKTLEIQTVGGFRSHTGSVDWVGLISEHSGASDSITHACSCTKLVGELDNVDFRKSSKILKEIEVDDIKRSSFNME